MERVPEAKDMRPTYENFTARCPWCERENIFNRTSDLKGADRIDHLEVKCFHSDCGRPFYLSGDRIDSAYQMIILDCNELLERKHYAYCILNLAQAYEVFFSQYSRVEYLYKPFARDPDRDIDHFNSLIKRLYQKTRRLSFLDLKNLCISHLLYENQPASMRDSENLISRIPVKPTRLSNEDIKAANIQVDEFVRELLLRLNSCKVPELRNRVVHQWAYRPSLCEVNEALSETRQILFPLGKALEVNVDDVNWYMRRRT